MDKYYITLQEVCKRISLSPRTLRAWVSNPASPLTCYKVGGKLLFRWSEVEKWLENFRVAPIDVDAIAKEIISDMKENHDDKSRRNRPV